MTHEQFKEAADYWKNRKQTVMPEYSYHDGKFWMFSEGGEKFIGIEY